MNRGIMRISPAEQKTLLLTYYVTIKPLELFRREQYVPNRKRRVVGN